MNSKQVIGEVRSTESVQVQFKTKQRSISFTVKNISLQDAYSKSLFMFKSLADEDDEVVLRFYNTKKKKIIIGENQ